MCIHYQFKIKLKERKNVHFLVGFKEIDFFIHDCFIEHHPYNPLYDKKDIKLKGYYKKRRKALNENGYKDFPLIIIK